MRYPRGIGVAMAVGAALSLAACFTGVKGEDGEPEPEPARSVIDLTVDGVYVIDKNAPDYDPSEMDVICPNGVTMTLAEFIWSQVLLFGFDITDSPSGYVAISNQAFAPSQVWEVVDSPPGDCQYTCYVCPDGAYVCSLHSGDPLLCSPPQREGEPVSFTTYDLGPGEPWPEPPDGIWTGPDDGPGGPGGGWDDGTGGSPGGGSGGDPGGGTGGDPGGGSGGGSGDGSSGGSGGDPGGGTGGGGWDW